MRPIDWTSVERVLVVRLRSIGDTVLSTPTLTSLRRALPDAQIDVLLEDWVAPILNGHPAVSNVLSVGREALERLRMARRIRRTSYDVVFNLHGGTTASMFVRAAGSRCRVGYSTYQYSFLYTHLLSSSADYWQRSPTHSAEQQLALAGFTGIDVQDLPSTSLEVNANSRQEVFTRLQAAGLQSSAKFALIHPSTAFYTKQWPVENYARVCEYLSESGVTPVAVASIKERAVLDQLGQHSTVPIVTIDDLDLPQIAAIAEMAEVFVGNDSGIAHIAAAVKTPSVVIFGSSNRDHWRPWTTAPYEIVFQPFDCQPCPGYECRSFGDSRCVTSIPAEAVIAAITRLLRRS